jgi:hypothetical protein
LEYGKHVSKKAASPTVKSKVVVSYFIRVKHGICPAGLAAMFRRSDANLLSMGPQMELLSRTR